MAIITHLLRLASALVTDRNRLALENVALQHQITVLGGLHHVYSRAA